MCSIVSMSLLRSSKAFLYSLDPDIGIKMLKQWDIPSLDTYDSARITALQNTIHRYAITAYVQEEQYHYAFAKVKSRPYIVYAMGNTDLLDQEMCAFVWPRKPSSYMEQVMQDVMIEAKKYNLVTISWWAPGIDTLCHTLSLNYAIPTIVVLWWWIVRYMERTHRHLLQRVIDAWGLVLSEYKLFQEPTKRSFPQRNRIIAWLAKMVFLPGAWIKSWSLITVDFALQMHTPVYTVPARIYDTTSAWTNTYLAEQRIVCCMGPEHMLESYFQKKNNEEQMNVASPALQWLAKDVYMCLDMPMSADVLATSVQQPVSCVLWELHILSLEWYVRESALWQWERI